MDSLQERLRALPAVDLLASRLSGPWPRALATAEARRALDSARAALLAGDEAGDPEAAARAVLLELAAPSLRPVINATGVILHTNLGRAPLAAFQPAGPYSNLEYDLESGRRGRRDAHSAPLLERLLGRPAIAVNNGAAAVYLALHELAGGGGEVVVSRGELIEIGDGFRIPDIMAHSGARLVEAGTTNRTRLDDYSAAITERTRLLLRVHPSNFRIQGFTGRPGLAELCALGRERGLPVFEDLGSGCLLDLRAFGVDEPAVEASFRAGVDLVSFSGDKLLGGPQAGILAGRADLVERCRRNPMFRALRLDKLQVQAMETTARHLLFENYDEVPALRMLRLSPEEIRARAAALLARWPDAAAEIVRGESLLGGGSTPEQTLPSWLIRLRAPAAGAEQALRRHQPPVIARIEAGAVVVDLRTVDPAQEDALLDALRSALECPVLDKNDRPLSGSVVVSGERRPDPAFRFTDAADS